MSCSASSRCVAARKRRANLVERGAERVHERQDPHLDEEAPGRDEHGRLARGEIHRRQAIGTIERVASAATALGVKREVGVTKRVEVAVDGPHRHAEALGELLGRHAGAPRPKMFGEREESSRPLHLERIARPLN